MNTVNALKHFAEGYAAWAYVFLFLGVLLEGELVMIFAGILTQLGVLNLQFVIITSFLGALTKTVSWYKLGIFLNRRFAQIRFFTYLEKRVYHLFPKFKENPFWSIFVSKFIYGVNHFVLILAGYSKMDFKTYFKAEFYSSMIWVPEMFSLGFFFSYAALGVTKEIHNFSLLILLFILGFVFFEKLVAFLYEVWEELKKEI